MPGHGTAGGSSGGSRRSALARLCCVCVPGGTGRGRRLREVRAYSAVAWPLLGMAGWLRCRGVTPVVREATSDCGKPVFCLLESAGLKTGLVDARGVRHLRGRPETGKLDAVWLAKAAERQMIRPRFVPPPQIRKLGDLARYRAGPGGCPGGGEAAGGKAAGGCPGQALGRGLRHFPAAGGGT